MSKSHTHKPLSFCVSLEPKNNSNEYALSWAINANLCFIIPMKKMTQVSLKEKLKELLSLSSFIFQTEPLKESFIVWT